jgi:hypothetical protein
MYSAFPYGSDEEADVGFAITELNWLQFLSDRFALLAGKITTLGTSNEFMGGEGRTQFMNFQLNFSATLAQLAPYSTLAASAIWLPNSTWTISTTLMNYLRCVHHVRLRRHWRRDNVGHHRRLSCQLEPATRWRVDQLLLRIRHRLSPESAASISTRGARSSWIRRRIRGPLTGAVGNTCMSKAIPAQ